MKDQIVNFETAVLAKVKGFDELCAYSYEGSVLSKTNKLWRNSEDPTEYAVPTQSLLQRWLREEYGIIVLVALDIVCMTYGVEIQFHPKCKYKTDKITKISFGSPYENNLEVGLQEALKLI